MSFSISQLARGACLIAVSCGSTGAIHAQGETLAEAIYDADSYIFMGTNREFDPEISINAHWEPTDAFPQFGHFNFGFIRFDLAGVPREGRKFLSVDLRGFILIPEDEPLAPPVRTTTGASIVHVVAPPRGDYFSPSVAKGDWYRLFVHEQPIVGTFNFAAAEGEGLGRYTIDVTETVDAWLDGTAENHGFALWAETGGVELGSTEGAIATGQPIAPRLTDAPSETGLTYAAWASGFWGAQWALNPSFSPFGDADADGLFNLEEYAWVRDPTVAEPELADGGPLILSEPEPPSLSVAGRAVWRFPLPEVDRPDARFTVETFAAIDAELPISLWGIEEVDGQDGATYQVADGEAVLTVTGGAERYFRLNVVEAGDLAQ